MSSIVTLVHAGCPDVTDPRCPLQVSSFRLSYYTLLNLLRRTEGGLHNMEHVISNSFQQFQQERAMPKVGRAVGWWLGRCCSAACRCALQSCWT
jgi:hypothetical protein